MGYRQATRDRVCSADLNGSNAAIALPKINPSTAVTFGLSFKYRNSSTRDLFCRPAGTSTKLSLDSTNHIVGQMAINSSLVTVTSPLQYLPGRWHHAVVRYNGSSLDLIVAGVTVASTSATGSITQDTSQFWNLGTLNNSTFTSCVLDDAFISTRALTDIEVQKIYLASIYPNDLQGLYNLSEGAGSIIVDSSPAATNGSSANVVYSSDVSISPRKSLNPNLIPNFGFEFAPPLVAPTSTPNTWVDGSAAGSSSNTLMGWFTTYRSGSATYGASFDSTVSNSGKCSMKVDVSAFTASTTPCVRLTNLTGNGWGTNPFYIKLQPNTAYTLTGYIKTANISSGSGDLGAASLTLVQANGSATRGVYLAQYLTGNNGWTRYSVSFTTSSLEVFADLILGIQNATGQIWFDDLSLTADNPILRALV